VGRRHNYLASPRRGLGYERNVATNTMLRKHGIEVIASRAASSGVAGVAHVA